MDSAMLADRPPALLAAIGLLILMEILWHRLRGSDGYDWRESAATLGVMAGQITIRAATAGIIVPVLYWVHAHRLTAIDPHHWAGWVALFLGVELAYYWFHRLSHEVRFMWANHCVHHSATRINLTAAFRLGWTNLLTGSWLFLLPLVWVGFHPLAVLGMFSLNLTYQLFLHTEAVGRLGPLEWVLNTPNHHRVHHGSEPDCLDCNYGGVLILFDRLFGTFRAVAPGRRLVYGLHGADSQPSYNPLRIAFVGWAQLLRDLSRARSPATAWRVLVGRP